MSHLFGHHAAPERPYPGCSYVARIDFEYGPHVFKSGQPFDREVIGITEAQAADLWIAGRLLVQAAAPVVEQPAPKPERKRKGG